MSFITRKCLPRRTVLKGMGATVALPFLDAMVPAGTAWTGTGSERSERTRLVAIEIVHGSAGSTQVGVKEHLWSPAVAGSNFDLQSTSLEPLQPFRNYLTIVSNTMNHSAEAWSAPEVGGDHFRSSATFLTQAHPKQTEGSDIHVGMSLDQVYAKERGQTTAIPSLQLCIEPIDLAGGCDYGYACVYTDAISWASPTEPLPAIRDPRAVFNQLFGVGGTPQNRRARREETASILDWLNGAIAGMRGQLGAGDRQRFDSYLENVREIERRLHNIEAHNQSGETRALPEAPVGVPDSFSEHVHLMMDLIVTAFQADLTRVVSFKLARDASSRLYPDSGVDEGFHPSSHHQENRDKVRLFQKLNTYHVSMVPYLLEKLKGVQDGDQDLLERSLVIYGSPMGDSNLHNHRRLPLFLAGHADGRLKGNLHIAAADDTPMANVWLAVLQKLGIDTDRFGDSTAALDLNAAVKTETAP
jgi:Protein of unknown function (DUF1552)